jgi:hypothetical protein
MVVFFPPAMTFPENPNSIDSPLAWNPLSTGIGKLPPGSLRAWWDASKLNANDIYWGYPSLYLSDCEGEVIYTASGTQGGNVITVTNSNNFLNGANYPGILLQIETDPGKQIYEVVSVINSNTFTVKPALTNTFSNQALYVAQLLKWPDASGNREHMGFWAVTDTYTPSIYILDGNSGKTYINGDIYNYGYGQFYFTGLNAQNKLLLSGGFGPIAMRELIVGDRALSDAERAEIEGYLAWKWGTDAKLPLQHPYASTPAQAVWNPAQLGNALELWLDANQNTSLFADTGCTIPANIDGIVDCWRDLSTYGRHFYDAAYLSHHHTYKIYKNKPSVSIFGGRHQHTDIAWMNNKNLFIAAVVDREPFLGQKRATKGGLSIDGGFQFPLVHNICIGGTAGYTNTGYQSHTQYKSQRSTLVLQGNVRNKPFYQPYFSKNMNSTLTTRSAPTYLHEQPYLMAIVADFMDVSVKPPHWEVPSLLGIVHPGSNYNRSVDTHRLFVLGMAPHFPGKFVVDHGWGGMAAYDYEVPLNTKAVYLVWRKDNTSPPIVTINGKLQQIHAADSHQAYLKVFTDRINMLAMSDHHFGWGYMRRFSGSIYEAMVLTGPKIKYGHQRLIEGYLAWKWGLQHLLPRSHSYRRVPPAR